MERNFLYVHSHELNENLRVRIGSLEGVASNLERHLFLTGGNIFVTVTVHCNKRSIGCPVSTSYKPPPTTIRHALHEWDEWLVLPIKYSELSRDSLLWFRLWDVSHELEPRFVTQATITLFNPVGVLRCGVQTLCMEKESSLDCSISEKPKELTNIDRLHRLTREYVETLIDQIDWLDRLTFPRIERLKREAENSQLYLFLMIELPRVTLRKNSYSIVYYEREDDLKTSPYNTAYLCDPEIDNDNLCEAKHHMLTRNARAEIFERELKPNASARETLEKILQMPSSHPISIEHRDMIWKFRYYLRSNKKALTKFVRSVHWNEAKEVSQALQLIREWSPLEAEDALELLSPSIQNEDVRRYAVSRLSEASHEEILLYLPQLLQALRYEPFTINESFRVSTQVFSSDDENDDVANNTDTCNDKLVQQVTKECKIENDLATFLIRSACNNQSVANYLYWFLKVEIEATQFVNPDVSEMYKAVRRQMISSLELCGCEMREWLQHFQFQRKLIDELVAVSKHISQAYSSRSDRTAALIKVLQEKSIFGNLRNVPLPLDANVRVTSVDASDTFLFNSNLMPMKIAFRTMEDEKYFTIFKRGDDLRQDQLVLQMIRLMDRILRADGLDLRLTPYHVLATSASEGLVQFVKAKPFRDVISTWGSITTFLQSFRPSQSGIFGIEQEAFNNYVRSCAGYSIICYILGIGDRHLHNILLCENGKMFHIDFGYILGRDPKILPPPMKLSPEMIQVMGGSDKKEWNDFRSLCFSAFNILRRHANVILNLFSLMLDAGIPDIALEKDKAVQKIEHRFHLDLNDDQANRLIQRLIDGSVNAKMPKIAEMMHDINQLLNN